MASGPAAEIPPDDSVGFTTRRAPPGNDGKCLELQLNDQIGGQGSSKKVLAPPTIVGPVKVKQGWFNVPSGGVSVDGGLFGFSGPIIAPVRPGSSPRPTRRSPGRRRAQPAPRTTIATASAAT